MLENNIPQAINKIDHATSKALHALGLFIVGKAVANLRKPRTHRGGGAYGTYDSGNLANSITYKVDTNSVDVGTPVEYGEYIEKGARAHWTSIDNLREWCRRKLGDAGLAAVIQRSIAREDMPAMPFLEPAFLENVAEMERIAGQEVKVVFPE